MLVVNYFLLYKVITNNFGTEDTLINKKYKYLFGLFFLITLLFAIYMYSLGVDYKIFCNAFTRISIENFAYILFDFPVILLVCLAHYYEYS